MSQDSSFAVLTDCTDLNFTHVSLTGAFQPSAVFSIENETLLTNNTDISPSQVIDNKSFLEKVKSLDAVDPGSPQKLVQCKLIKQSIGKKHFPREYHKKVSIQFECDSTQSFDQTIGNNLDQNNKSFKNVCDKINVTNVANSSMELDSRFENNLSCIRNYEVVKNKNLTTISNFSMELESNIENILPVNNNESGSEDFYKNIPNNDSEKSGCEGSLVQKRIHKNIPCRKISVCFGSDSSIDLVNTDVSLLKTSITEPNSPLHQGNILTSLELDSNDQEIKSDTDLIDKDAGKEVPIEENINECIIHSPGNVFCREGKLKHPLSKMVSVPVAFDTDCISENGSIENVNNEIGNILGTSNESCVEIHEISVGNKQIVCNSSEIDNVNKLSNSQHQLSGNSDDIDNGPKTHKIKKKIFSRVSVHCGVHSSMEVSSTGKGRGQFEQSRLNHVSENTNISENNENNLICVKNKNVEDIPRKTVTENKLNKNSSNYDSLKSESENDEIENKIHRILASQDKSIHHISPKSLTCSDKILDNHLAELGNEINRSFSTNYLKEGIINKSLENSFLNIAEGSKSKKIKIQRVISTKKISVCFGSDSSINLLNRNQSLLSTNIIEAKSPRKTNILSSELDPDHEGFSSKNTNIGLLDKELGEKVIMEENTNLSDTQNTDYIVCKEKKLKNMRSRKVSVPIMFNTLNITENDSIQNEVHKIHSSFGTSNESNAEIHKTDLENKQDIDYISNIKNINQGKNSLNQSTNNLNNIALDINIKEIKKKPLSRVSVHFSPDSTIETRFNAEGEYKFDQESEKSNIRSKNNENILIDANVRSESVLTSNPIVENSGYSMIGSRGVTTHKEKNITDLSTLPVNRKSMVTEHYVAEKTSDSVVRNELNHSASDNESLRSESEDGAIKDNILRVLASQDKSIHHISPKSLTCSDKILDNHLAELGNEINRSFSTNYLKEGIINKSLENSFLNIAEGSKSKKIKIQRVISTKKISVCFGSDSSINLLNRNQSLLSTNIIEAKSPRKTNILSSELDPDHEGFSSKNTNIGLLDKELGEKVIMEENTNLSDTQNTDYIVCKGKKLKNMGSRKVSVPIAFNALNTTENNSIQIEDYKIRSSFGTSNESSAEIHETDLENKQDIDNISNIKNINQGKNSLNHSKNNLDKIPHDINKKEIMTKPLSMVSVHFSPDSTTEPTFNGEEDCNFYHESEKSNIQSKNNENILIDVNDRSAGVLISEQIEKATNYSIIGSRVVGTDIEKNKTDVSTLPVNRKSTVNENYVPDKTSDSVMRNELNHSASDNNSLRSESEDGAIKDNILCVLASQATSVHCESTESLNSCSDKILDSHQAELGNGMNESSSTNYVKEGTINKSLENSFLNLSEGSKSKKVQIQKVYPSKKISICFGSDSLIDLVDSDESLLRRNSIEANSPRRTNILLSSDLDLDHERFSCNTNNDLLDKESGEEVVMEENINLCVTQNTDYIACKEKKLKNMGSRKVSVPIAFNALNTTENNSIQIEDYKIRSSFGTSNESSAEFHKTDLESKQNIDNILNIKSINQGNNSLNQSTNNLSNIHLDINKKEIKTKTFSRVSVHFSPDSKIESSYNAEEESNFDHESEKSNIRSKNNENILIDANVRSESVLTSNPIVENSGYSMIGSKGVTTHIEKNITDLSTLPVNRKSMVTEHYVPDKSSDSVVRNELNHSASDNESLRSESEDGAIKDNILRVLASQATSVHCESPELLNSCSDKILDSHQAELGNEMNESSSTNYVKEGTINKSLENSVLNLAEGSKSKMIKIQKVYPSKKISICFGSDSRIDLVDNDESLLRRNIIEANFPRQTNILLSSELDPDNERFSCNTNNDLLDKESGENVIMEESANLSDTQNTDYIVSKEKNLKNMGSRKVSVPIMFNTLNITENDSIQNEVHKIRSSFGTSNESSAEIHKTDLENKQDIDNISNIKNINQGKNSLNQSTNNLNNIPLDINTKEIKSKPLSRVSVHFSSDSKIESRFNAEEECNFDHGSEKSNIRSKNNENILIDSNVRSESVRLPHYVLDKTSDSVVRNELNNRASDNDSLRSESEDGAIKDNILCVLGSQTTSVHCENPESLNSCSGKILDSHQAELAFEISESCNTNFVKGDTMINNSSKNNIRNLPVISEHQQTKTQKDDSSGLLSDKEPKVQVLTDSFTNQFRTQILNNAVCKERKFQNASIQTVIRPFDTFNLTQNVSIEHKNNDLDCSFGTSNGHNIEFNEISAKNKQNRSSGINSDNHDNDSVNNSFCNDNSEVNNIKSQKTKRSLPSSLSVLINPESTMSSIGYCKESQLKEFALDRLTKSSELVVSKIQSQNTSLGDASINMCDGKIFPLNSICVGNIENEQVEDINISMNKNISSDSICNKIKEVENRIEEEIDLVPVKGHELYNANSSNEDTIKDKSFEDSYLIVSDSNRYQKTSNKVSNTLQEISNKKKKPLDLQMSVGLSIIHKDNEELSGSPNIEKICHSTPRVEYQRFKSGGHEKNSTGEEITCQNHVFVCPDIPSRILRERSVNNKSLLRSKRYRKDTENNSESLTKKSKNVYHSADVTDDFIHDISIIPNTKAGARKKMFHSTPINKTIGKKNKNIMKVSINNAKTNGEEHIEHDDKMIQVSKTIFGSSTEVTNGTVSKKKLEETSASVEQSCENNKSQSKRKRGQGQVYSDVQRLKELESSGDSRSYHSDFLSTLENESSYYTRSSKKRVAFKDISALQNSTIGYGNSISDSSYQKSVKFREVISVIDNNTSVSDLRDIENNSNLTVVNHHSGIDLNNVSNLEETESRMDRSEVSINYVTELTPEIILTENGIEGNSAMSMECSLFTKMKVLSKCQKGDKKIERRKMALQNIKLIREKERVKGGSFENDFKFASYDHKTLDKKIMPREKWVSPNLIKFLNEKLMDDALDYVVNSERIISILCSAVNAVKNLRNVNDIELALLPLKNVLVRYKICYSIIEYSTFISRFTPFEFQCKALPVGGYYGSIKRSSNKILTDPILIETEIMSNFINHSH